MSNGLETSLYHKCLRVVALVLAVIVSFESGIFSSTTARLTEQTELYLANAVSIQVGVPENEVNILTARIAELEGQLSAPAERSLNIGLGTSGVPDRSTFILSGILFILLVLIVLNYALDYARSRESRGRAAIAGSVA
jgi:hypothetical protein